MPGMQGPSRLLEAAGRFAVVEPGEWYPVPRVDGLRHDQPEGRDLLNAMGDHPLPDSASPADHRALATVP